MGQGLDFALSIPIVNVAAHSSSVRSRACGSRVWPSCSFRVSVFPQRSRRRPGWCQSLSRHITFSAKQTLLLQRGQMLGFSVNVVMLEALLGLFGGPLALRSSDRATGTSTGPVTCSPTSEVFS